MNLRGNVFATLADRTLMAVSFFLFMLLTQLAFGQGITTGSITGTVEDPQQSVISGAKITAVNNGTNSVYSAITNSVGYFEMRGVPVGNYTVSIEASGFSKTRLNNVAVNAAVPTSVGLRQLALQSASTEVTVEALAPLIQTDSVQTGESFETKKLMDLPIGNGPDLVALFTPGVVPTGDANFANTNGAAFSSNGQRGRDNNFQIDGQANNDSLIGGPSLFIGNQDAIEEVQVLTNYSAEYGRNSGTIVNYITKGGTNTFHGTAFEIYNGNWADSLASQERTPLNGFCPPGVAVGTAIAPFTDSCTAPVVPRYVDNRYGGTVGGPILHDKLWFFAGTNIEINRVGSSPSSSGSLVSPTPNGLSQLQAAFPGNAAVAALANIGPLAVKQGTPSFTSVQSIPVLGVPIEFGSIVRNLPSIFNDHEANGRIDYQMTQSDRLFGRYLFQQQINTNVAFIGALGLAQGDFVDVPARVQEAAIDYAHTFSPNVLDQTRFSYSRSNIGFEGGAFPKCLRSSFGLCGTAVTFTDGKTLNLGQDAGFPQGRFVIDYQVQNNASWHVGNHSFKFGGEFDRQRQPNSGLANVNGTFFFSSFDNFIRNTATRLSLTDGPPTIDFQENQVAAYFQDDWRVKDNLTLTFGTRYEINGQANNILHDLTLKRESDPATAFWSSSVPLSSRIVPKLPLDKNNFGPVVGFSWSPRMLSSLLGHDQTVIRGGFRIAYNPEFYNLFTNVAASTPAVNAGRLTNCTNCLPASGNAADVQKVNLPNVQRGVDPGIRTQSIVDPNLHNPYSEQWNLGIQRQFGSKVVFEARYVGDHGVGLYQTINANPALGTLVKNGFANFIPAGLTPCATSGAPGFAQGYADCNHTNVLKRGNYSFSIYHGLQNRIQFQNWHGVTAGATYTWSRTIDNASEIFSTTGGGSTQSYAQNPFNTNTAERGTSGLDYPNVATVYMLYDVPLFRNRSGIGGLLLGGWEINPTWRYTSGQPYTVIEAFNSTTNLCDPTSTDSSTFSACRPIMSNPNAPLDTVGQYTGTGQLVNFFTGDPVSKSDIHWIANDLNAAKVLGTPYGGAGRNLQRGDTINAVNLALLKNLKLTERFTVQLRGIAYNVLNRDYRGVTDFPYIDAGNFRDAQGGFANTFFNPTGNAQSNSVFSGIDRRRIEVGAKIIF
ncbi:MAG: TonB-dependent receptor domain-containing protein [Terriglobales bacterium]